MQIKRIIPCLDISNGRVVKGVNFINLIDAGDPVEIAKGYNNMQADEIVFLDITSRAEDRTATLDVIAQAAKEISIPLTIGGGIASLADIRAMLDLGASKVSINSAAVSCPSLISDAVKAFGSSAIIVAIDTKKVQGRHKVFTNGGKTNTGLDTTIWAKEAERLGAGEILLTSMDCDGTKSGYDIDITRAVAESVDIPVIASGGAGSKEHFLQVLTKGEAAAALAASLFHFNEVNINDLKTYLADNGITVKR